MTSSSETIKSDKINILYKHVYVESSLEEFPSDEWSSLILKTEQDNSKKTLYSKGLYDPGPAEICTKYLPISDSSIFQHVYYTYPGILDPGIVEALTEPENKTTYANDGQNLYLDLCKHMNIHVIRSFHRALLTAKVDLRYYGINPIGIRAISMALKLNTNVRILDLTDNWLTNDACYHLGQMLIHNVTIQELNLHGCRIQSEGAQQLLYQIYKNKSLLKLNLSHNQLGDDGVKHIIVAISKGAYIKELNISFNNLSSKAAAMLAEGFESNNILTHLDISWNQFRTPLGFCALFRQLSINEKLKEVNLSWNNLKGSLFQPAITSVLKAPNLTYLNLSNNMLCGPEISAIAINLKKAKKLHTLDLSFNPLSSTDALILILRLQDRAVKVQNLLLENVTVTSEFLKIRSHVLELNFRKNCVISYGSVIGNFVIEPADMRTIVLRRAEYLAKASKANRVDIALFFLKLLEDNTDPIDIKQLTYILKFNGIKFDEDLILELVRAFPGPKIKGVKSLDLKALADYMKRIWPQKKLPPTPQLIIPIIEEKIKKSKKSVDKNKKK